jgi:hypothetical protein
MMSAQYGFHECMKAGSNEAFCGGLQELMTAQ